MIEVFTMAIATTMIMVGSRIFSPFREFMYSKHELIGYFFSCPMCLGFWIGVAFSIFYGNILFLAFGTSLFSWIVYNTIISLSQVGDYYADKMEKK